MILDRVGSGLLAVSGGEWNAGMSGKEATDGGRSEIGRGDSAQALSKPMWPLMRATPASLLAMREGIAAMRFPGHCQQWSEPRARIDAGVLCRNKRSDTVGQPLF